MAAVVEKCDFLSLKFIHSWLDTALKCPSQHQNVVKELLHVFKETEINSKCLRTALAFHKSLRPAPVFILERKLLASGILHEGNMAKPCLSSLLSRILFEVVSASSTECADYCASVWMERYVEPRANGREMLATNSQHCCMLHVTAVCTPCCMLLRVVAQSLKTVKRLATCKGTVQQCWELKMKKWSSQWTQFMQLRKEAWKKFRTSTGFEPVTSQLPVRCGNHECAKGSLTMFERVHRATERV